MAGRHSGKPPVPLRKLMTRKHWIAVGAGAAATVLLSTGGIFATANYLGSSAHDTTVTAYSINDLASNSQNVSRSNLRTALKNGAGDASADSQYVKVVFNGQSRIVLGENFTTVKSVLEAGNITLEATDKITPALDEKVTESTVITIERADSKVETIKQSIPFNTVTIKDSSIPTGTTKVVKEGEKGVIEQTNIVTHHGKKVVSRSTVAEFVAKAPVNKEIHVGTGAVTTSASSTASTSSSRSSSKSSSSSQPRSTKSSTNYGTTIPVSEAQSIAHQLVIARGWSESDFTALVKLWNRESGWRTTAANPSGAYGIPQALPGSKMASAGADWQTNAETQIKWGIQYIAGRYGTPSAAWAHSQSTGWY